MAGLRKGRNEHKKRCLFHGNQRVHSGSRPPIKSLWRNSLLWIMHISASISPFLEKKFLILLD